MSTKHLVMDRHLGARVRAARIDKKISQTVLGDQIGVSFQQVQKYELGKDRISASQLLCIARTLDKDISFFFEDIREDDQDVSGEIATDHAVARMPRTTTTYDIKIIRMLHAIDDERVKMKLYDLMEAIVGARTELDRSDGKSVGKPWFEEHFG